MAAIMWFIDTSKCIGCKACQVACKQWHSLSAETTSFTGSYTNPPDLSEKTLTNVNFQEMQSGGKLMYTFLKRQCMHCNQAKCQAKCPKGVEKTSEGFVVFNDDCTPENVRLTKKQKNGLTPEQILALQMQLFLTSCPHLVPRYDAATNKFVKCDSCFDRFGGGGNYTTYRNGSPTTACELTCPVGAIVTGDKNVIMAAAKARLKKVKSKNNKATLWGGRGRVIYLLTENPANYRIQLGTGQYKLGNYGLVSV
jgi:formate dehydrogenase iron-sulfur subunit